MNLLHPQFLSAEQSALVVIDIQEKLFATMSPQGQENLNKNTPILLAAAMELGLPTIVTEQYPRGIGRTIASLRPKIEGLPVIEKVTFSAAEVPEFTSALGNTGRRRVILCGMESHICVYQTALGLLALDYDVHVVADCLATRDPANHLAALALMRRAGCTIEVTESALFQLLEKAGTESFKCLQKLII